MDEAFCKPLISRCGDSFPQGKPGDASTTVNHCLLSTKHYALSTCSLLPVPCSLKIYTACSMGSSAVTPRADKISSTVLTGVIVSRDSTSAGTSSKSSTLSSGIKTCSTPAR